MRLSLVFSVMYVLAVAGSCFAGLKSDIDSLIRAQAPARYSVAVVDGGSGELVYGHHERVALIPASNMKVVASAVALQYLGAEYEFVTRVGMVGDVLVVIGAGDPLLGDVKTDKALEREPGWIFRNIAERLGKLGVKRLGGMVVDSTFFDDERVHPSWPASELNKHYSAEVCGLNYYTNRIDLVISNDKGRVRVETDPLTSFLRFSNEVKVISKGDQGISALRKIGKPNQIVLRGKVRSSQSVGLAVEQPAAYFGFMLAEELQRRGIAVEGQLIEAAVPTDKPFDPVAEYRTPLRQ
ncbi:MAG: D-alanyl-D-alanine carboxypeptidase, partial [Desulfobacterales bacterium]|nr:D-alanyl-D-alanine carboxypeptidase [Desulfobacterales bacterium]